MLTCICIFWVIACYEFLACPALGCGDKLKTETDLSRSPSGIAYIVFNQTPDSHWDRAVHYAGKEDISGWNVRCRFIGDVVAFVQKDVLLLICNDWRDGRSNKLMVVAWNIVKRFVSNKKCGSDSNSYDRARMFPNISYDHVKSEPVGRIGGLGRYERHIVYDQIDPFALDKRPDLESSYEAKNESEFFNWGQTINPAKWSSYWNGEPAAILFYASGAIVFLSGMLLIIAFLLHSRLGSAVLTLLIILVSIKIIVWGH